MKKHVWGVSAAVLLGGLTLAYTPATADTTTPPESQPTISVNQ